MRGHIRERSPGHWAIVLESRDPQTGKRKHKWHSFKGTKREARIECSRLITEAAGHRPRAIQGHAGGISPSVARTYATADQPSHPRALYRTGDQEHHPSARQCDPIEAARCTDIGGLHQGTRQRPQRRQRRRPFACERSLSAPGAEKGDWAGC
jgi:hypothetical protein